MRAEAQAGSSFHAPSLDGIRALAFALVFVGHAGLGELVPGGFGVTVFFFLSGYLITSLLRIEHDATGTFDLRQFYLRRALRIWPPFYIVLALAVAAEVAGLIHGGLHANAVGAQVVHLANYWIVWHGYDGQPSGTGVYWSLAVEEHFYLLFPWLYLGLRRMVRSAGRQALVLWSLCGLVLAWRCVLVYGLHASEDRTYMATDTRFDSILFGCALAVHGNPMLDAPSRIPGAVWKWILVPGSAAVLAFCFLFRDAGFRETFRYTVQGVALRPLFVVAMRFSTWGPMKLLNTRALAFGGVLSYVLYLVHYVVLDALAPVVGTGLGRAVLALAVSVSIAWTMHRFVEIPAARLRNRLAFRIARHGALAPAEARAR
ncbi:MAG TPA: acyltransferase [Polyangiaceae bacterium]|nr:acyltransferase [Polyangiaceae bacterium]